MWEAIFTALSNPITGDSSFVVFLKNCLTAIIQLFITSSTNGTTTTYAVTDFGYLFFAVVGVSFLFWGLAWVTKLCKLRN